MSVAGFNGSATTRLEWLFGLPSYSMPTWIGPDELVFLSDRSGVPQVWHLALQTGRVSQLTHYPERVQSLLASPLSRRVIFGMDRGGNERQQLWALDPDSGQTTELTKAADAIHEPGALSPDGQSLVYRSNERDVAAFDVMLLRFDGEEPTPRRVLVGEGQLVPLDVSDGGERILVKRLVSNLDADLLLLDVASGDVQLLNSRSDEAWLVDARFGLDESIWLLTNEGSDVVNLERLDSATGERSTILAEDWDVESFALSPAGDAVATAVNRDGSSELAIRRLASDETTLGQGLSGGVLDHLAWSPDGDRFAVGWSRPDAPSAIQVVRLNGAVTEIAGGEALEHSQLELRKPQIVRFESFDQRSIPALWFTPVTPAPWPVVVDVHGGPESQRRTAFAPLTQFFLGEGYAVLAPNVRGSTGYGKAYSHLDDRDKRMDAVADLQEAHRWLADRPDVRSDAIVVMGQSYGGFMTLAALTEYPDLWAAGVDVVGIANFVTFLERTGPWRRAHRAAEYGDLERDREVLESISPIVKVDRIAAPLMVIHGRNDPRVPLHEAEQIVSALRERGCEVELLLFDDEGHGLSKRSNRIEGYGAVAAFLARVLGERG